MHFIYIPYLSGTYMGDVCSNICLTQVTSTNYVTRNTVHISTKYIPHYWHISPNKYGCYIAVKHHTALIVYGHIDQILMHTCVKTQLNGTATSHAIAIYMCVTIKYVHNLHMYAISFMAIFGGYMCINVAHMKSPASTKSPGELYAYCTYCTSYYWPMPLNTYG